MRLTQGHHVVGLQTGERGRERVAQTEGIQAHRPGNRGREIRQYRTLKGCRIKGRNKGALN